MSEKLTAPESAHLESPGWTRARIAFLSVSGVLLVALLGWARDVLLPFVLALVIAYVLTPLVAFFERRRLPRSGSILLVYVLVLGSLYWSIAGVAPRLYRETSGIVREIPTLLRQAGHAIGPKVDTWIERISPQTNDSAQDPRGPAAIQIRPGTRGGFDIDIGSGIDITQESASHLRIESTTAGGVERFRFSRFVDDADERVVEYLKKNVMQLVDVGRAIVVNTSRGIFLVFMTLMVAGYLMHTRDQVVEFFRNLAPASSRLSFDRLLFRMERGLSGVVRGQLVICLVNGLLSALGFWLFGLKYWPVLSLLAAVGSLIPIFGSILANVPAVLLGLSQDFWTALWVLLWVLGIHQLEANFLNPKIIGTAAKIHPCLVVFVLIIGEHFFGLWGALLAVPAWSLLQSVFLHCRSLVIHDAVDTVLPLFEAYRASKPPPGVREVPPSSRWPLGPPPDNSKRG
jgi:predicted PurR-regulated permease PerM